MSAIYWRLRWWLWDFRDALFVASVNRRVGQLAVLYVHPNGRSAPALKIVRLPESTDGEPHGHVEGRATGTELPELRPTTPSAEAIAIAHERFGVHVDRVASGYPLAPLDTPVLLGRYASVEHPDIGGQERNGSATYVYISDSHTIDRCPFGPGYIIT